MLEKLTAANSTRQREWNGDVVVSGLFRAVELGGEAGEALNIVKKLEREALGVAGSRATLDDLAKEIGDVIICADLLAQKYRLNTGNCVVYAFNKTSRQHGFKTIIKH